MLVISHHGNGFERLDFLQVVEDAGLAGDCTAYLRFLAHISQTGALYVLLRQVHYVRYSRTRVRTYDELQLYESFVGGSGLYILKSLKFLYSQVYLHRLLVAYSQYLCEVRAYVRFAVFFYHRFERCGISPGRRLADILKQVLPELVQVGF